MRIVIDGRMYQESGIGRYIRNLLHHLQIIDKKNDYSVLLTKESYREVVLRDNFKKVLADFTWYGVGEQIKLLSLLRSFKPDLVHFPHFNVPILYQGKFVVTIHDLIHQHFQMRRATTHNPIIYKVKQIGYRIIFKNAISKSVKILVPSKFVKDLLADKWQVDSKKIIVTHEAVDDKILKLRGKSPEANLAKGGGKVLEKFKINSPYIFYVGNAHPHKNVEGLIRAFLALKKNYRYLQLVLSGHDHYFWQRIKITYSHKDIIYTGKVSDIELVALYKNAKCFVLPSFEEGFGIPVLEAMTCECPVVSSNAGALREVGGDACLYFDSKKQGDMGDKIKIILKQENLRKQLIELGRERVKKFSWKNLAKKTLEVYLECG